VTFRSVPVGDKNGPTGQVYNDHGNKEIPREFQQSADVNHDFAIAKHITKLRILETLIIS
jgi:hypothetical protein